MIKNLGDLREWMLRKNTRKYTLMYINTNHESKSRSPSKFSRERATEGISWFCFQRISLNRGIKTIMSCSCRLLLVTRRRGQLSLVDSHTLLTAQNGHNASFLGKFKRKLWKFRSLNYNSSCKTNHVNRKLRRGGGNYPNIRQIWTNLFFLAIAVWCLVPSLEFGVEYKSSWRHFLEQGDNKNVPKSQAFLRSIAESADKCSWWKIKIAILGNINPLLSYLPTLGPVHLDFLHRTLTLITRRRHPVARASARINISDSGGAVRSSDTRFRRTGGIILK